MEKNEIAKILIIIGIFLLILAFFVSSVAGKIIVFIVSIILTITAKSISKDNEFVNVAFWIIIAILAESVIRTIMLIGFFAILLESCKGLY